MTLASKERPEPKPFTNGDFMSYYPRIQRSNIIPNTKLGTGVILSYYVDHGGCGAVEVEDCKNRATAEYLLRQVKAKLAKRRKNRS